MKRPLVWITCAGFLVSVSLTAAAHAYSSDRLIEGAKLCTRYLPNFERQYGIPTHLLAAIATTETGRYHEGLGLQVPWPWTINVEGKGYYFDSKQEAIAAVQRFRSRGIKSIDIGCMQVNLYHHPNAFASLEEGFEPQTNIAYAASFLRNLYEGGGGSWRKASAEYHSKTQSRGSEYVERVYDHWQRILDKLRQARVQVPESSVAALSEPSAPVARTQLASAQPAKPAYQPMRMRTIELSKKNRTMENGIIVVRPPRTSTNTVQASSEPAIPDPAPVMTLAQLKPVAQPPVASGSKTVQIDNPQSPKQGDKKAGPTFIFND
ncbi:MAG: transglycosylase SLT domain-containing protein [Rickettsiales bacterium]|nr:transglycosylase SLT domain-containing protein [Rickettsiales bacterium]